MERVEVAKRDRRRRAIAGASVALALVAGGCGTEGGTPSGVAAGGSITAAPSTEAISSATCPVVDGSERMTVAVSLVEQLLRTEAIFRRADPGSPAQFRARESADELRYRLETLVGRRCLSKQAVPEPSVP